MKKPFILVDKDFHENNGEFTESIQCKHVAIIDYKIVVRKLWLGCVIEIGLYQSSIYL